MVCIEVSHLLRISKLYLDSVSSLEDIEHGGRKIFQKMGEVFLEEFLASYSDHIKSVWTSNEILPYALGGNPKLVHIFASWLHHYSDNSGAGEDGNVYEFFRPNESIDLDGQDIHGQSIDADAAKCMQYLTANADPIKILEDPGILSERDLLWKLTSEQSPINLLDQTTWDNKPLKINALRIMSNWQLWCAKQPL